jgi:hypothetical protein
MMRIRYVGVFIRLTEKRPKQHERETRSLDEIAARVPRAYREIAHGKRWRFM